MTRGWVRVLGLIALALALRVPQALRHPPLEGDARDYVRLATSLREGAGFVDEGGGATAFRPPLYPLFVAALGAKVPAVLLVQCLLGAANCLLLVVLGRRLLGPGPAPWLAGTLLAADPVHASACARLLSESLYESLVLLTLLFLSDPRGPRLMIAGGMAGLAVLARTAGLPFVLFLDLWLLLGRRRLAAVAFFTGTVSLVTLPWIVRNDLVMGAPVLTTQGGITLYSSYRPPQGRIFGVLVHDDEVAEASALGEVAADRRLTRAACHLAVSSPRETLRLALLKVAFLWVPIDWEILRPSGRIAPVYLFALPLAAVAGWRQRRRWLLPLILLGGLTLFSAVVYGSPRLRLPFEPVIYLMAADTLVAAYRRPRLWAWAVACGGLWLANDLPKEYVRLLATRLGIW